MSALTFFDPITGRQCELVIPPDGRIFPLRADEPKIGIRHPGCDATADLSVDLDAFYCPSCGQRGRVSGMWCIDMIEALS